MNGYLIIPIAIILLISIIFLIIWIGPKNKKINIENLSYNINDKKVVACFMVRDGESYLEKNLKEINKYLSENFKTYEIIYVENDSKDDTRNILKNLEKEMPLSGIMLNMTDKFSSSMCKGKKNCKKRFRFLASLRQKLLDRIKKEFSNYDYQLLLDLDFVDFDQNELTNMFKIIDQNNYDAIFGMSIVNNKPYDVGAIRNLFTMIHYLLFFKKNKSLSKVSSAFSGFGIYNIKSLIKYNANYNLITNSIEHIDLNRKLPTKYIYNNFTPQF